jgi:hypothetical protein
MGINHRNLMPAFLKTFQFDLQFIKTTKFLLLSYRNLTGTIIAQGF